MRKSVRSEVDFVLTFEEMAGIFDAKHVDLTTIGEDPDGVNDASTDGRNFAVSGGVAQAVVNVIKARYPDKEVKVTSAEGLRECRKMMKDAAAGKYPGYLLEGMALPRWLCGRCGHYAADQKISGSGEPICQTGQPPNFQ